MRPKLVIYDTGRDITTKVVLKFAQGTSIDKNWEVRFQKIDRFKRSGFDRTLRPGIDAVASLGILRGTGEMFRAAMSAGIDYYYMDHAYYNPGYKGPGWMRIVKNSHTMNRISNSTGERYCSLFQSTNPILPWKTSVAARGDLIIICPPTHAVSWYAGIGNDWTERTIAQIKSILPTKEHNRIVVRPKPNEPIVNSSGELIEMKQNTSTTDINNDLANAQCVIAYNSMVALSATLRGIPVIGSDYSCCKPISFKIEDLATPHVFDVEPADRVKLIHWLADNQWNITEIQNGTAWRNLQEMSQ